MDAWHVTAILMGVRHSPSATPPLASVCVREEGRRSQAGSALAVSQAIGVSQSQGNCVIIIYENQ